MERIKHNLRKQAQEEVTPISSIYNDPLVFIATNSEENEALAVSLPTFASLKSSLFWSCKSRQPLSLKAKKTFKLKAGAKDIQDLENSFY